MNAWMTYLVVAWVAFLFGYLLCALLTRGQRA